MSIAENLKQVLAELPQGVRLVAVSKFHPNEAIEEAYIRTAYFWRKQSAGNDS